MRQINEDIKQGKLRQVYLLYGEERYLRRQYRDKLRGALCEEGDTMNVHFFEGRGIDTAAVIDLAETMPFFARRRVIFLSDSGLFKSGGEKLAEYLANPSETAFFVFTESEVDKRSRLYKAVQSRGYAAEFAVQDENTLKAPLQVCSNFYCISGLFPKQIVAVIFRQFLNQNLLPWRLPSR